MKRQSAAPASHVLRATWLARPEARLDRQRTDLRFHLPEVFEDIFGVSVLMRTLADKSRGCVKSRDLGKLRLA